MYKFSVVSLDGKSREIPYLIKELRKLNLISGTEKDISGETVYITNSINAVKKLMEDYEGLILDIHRN